MSRCEERGGRNACVPNPVACLLFLLRGGREGGNYSNIKPFEMYRKPAAYSLATFNEQTSLDAVFASVIEST
jgi:hypothetical protein